MVSVWDIVTVGIGGFVGSVFRYLINQGLTLLLPITTFPYGVMIVNTVGCLLIGLLSGMSLNKLSLSPSSHLFFFTGILGGLTTFSAFSFDAFHMLQTKDLTSLALAVLHISFHVVVGISAVYIGYLISEAT